VKMGRNSIRSSVQNGNVGFTTPKFLQDQANLDRIFKEKVLAQKQINTQNQSIANLIASNHIAYENLFKMQRTQEEQLKEKISRSHQEDASIEGSMRSNSLLLPHLPDDRKNILIDQMSKLVSQLDETRKCRQVMDDQLSELQAKNQSRLDALGLHHEEMVKLERSNLIEAQKMINLTSNATSERPTPSPATINTITEELLIDVDPVIDEEEVFGVRSIRRRSQSSATDLSLANVDAEKPNADSDADETAATATVMKNTKRLKDLKALSNMTNPSKSKQSVVNKNGKQRQPRSDKGKPRQKHPDFDKLADEEDELKGE
jgi:hypothetical protein